MKGKKCFFSWTSGQSFCPLLKTHCLGTLGHNLERQTPTQQGCSSVVESVFSKSHSLAASMKESFHFYPINLLFTFNDLASKVKENLKILSVFLRPIVSFPALESYWRYLQVFLVFMNYSLMYGQMQGAEVSIRGLLYFGRLSAG